MKQELFDKLIHLKKAADALAKDQNRLAMEQLSNTEQLKRLIIQLDHTLESARESVEILPPPLPKIVQNPVPKPDLEGIGAVSPKTETPKPETPKVEVPKAEIPEPKPSKPEPSKPERKIDWEKFIGENLMSKLGIVIILIGVAIFGKYAIDNDLISPLGRILCGAGLGVAFIGTGLWLKKSVENLSAILVAGGTAVLYLMTYFAYDFYQMMPMVAAGGLMLLISAFTFWSAIFYKKEVIAIYGQLCSYVIPLVISNGTGNLLNFLTYIVIINAVITALAVVYKWKKAYGLSFIITSGVVLWINSKYNATADFAKLIVLISLNMLIYYVSMAWIKAKEGGWLASYDSLMVVTQTLLFFVVGYHQAWMESGFSGGKLTVVLITFAVNALLAAWLYSRNDADCKALGNTAVVCVALAVGYAFFDFFGIKTFSVLLSLQMAAMYYFAVRENSTLFRVFSYIKLAIVIVSLMVLLGINLWEGKAWSSVITMLIVAAIVTFMTRINARLTGENGNSEQKLLTIAVMLLVWLAAITSVIIVGSHCVMLYVIVTLIILTAANYLFGNVWNWGKGFSNVLRTLAVAAQFIAVPTLIVMINSHSNYVTVRYISWAVLAASFYLNNTKALTGNGAYVVGVLSSLLAVTTYEVYDYAEERFVLSIWWGAFAVACMYVGLVKKSKLFRVYGIVILSATLLKLFFIDLSHLTTMAKVAIFIGLGVLMLIGTYFYQKNNKGMKE